MKTKTALAPEFRGNKTNKRKTKLFHVLVFLLLGFVLIGTASPFVARLSVKTVQVVETVRGNLAFEKREAIEPLAPSFRNQIKEKVDPSVFEIKEFKEVDDYSLEAVDSRGVSAIFGNQTDLQNQVSSLQTLLVKSRIEAKKVKKIDLRFNKTVVEYQ